MRIFMSPPSYIQGPGVMAQLPALAVRHGRRPLLIADAGITPLLPPVLRDSFAAAGMALQLHPFAGEGTLANLDTLTDHARPVQPDVIVGIGGGRAVFACVLSRGTSRRTCRASA